MLLNHKPNPPTERRIIISPCGVSANWHGEMQKDPEAHLPRQFALTAAPKSV